ncbi:MAG: DNA polymerase III subunit beta [Dehalococcoidia bacterium]|nr:DNA polymerase III subunit beta [Dehalococcoidia bacterium]
MRATTKRGALLETLGKVKSAVAARHTLPVLGAVMIRVGGGQLTLTATNLEVSLTAFCKATVTREGAIAVLPKTLEAFLKAVKSETVTLSLVNNKLLRVEAGAVTTLEGFEAQEFPDVPGVRGKAVEVRGLADALKQISYAMASDDSRPVLKGVCFAPGKGTVVLCAADGFRLAETKVKAKGSIEQTVVPSTAVQLIEKLMPGKVSIHRKKEDGQSDKYPTISFVGDGLVLTAMAIQGTYPNYKQVIPRNGSPVTMDSKALREALNLVSITLPDNNVVRMQSQRGNVILSTKNEERGETQVKVPAKGKVKIAFNAEQLKGLLSRTSGAITLRTTSAQSPGVVRQNGTIHVLMPMFVEW